MKPKQSPTLLGPPGAEFASVDLGDRRRAARLVRVVDAAWAQPEAGLPVQAGSDAALEGTYRLLSNPAVSPEKILAPHVRCTIERARAASVALVLQDTSEFQFGGEAPRCGLGRLRAKGQGFYGHFALAVDLGGRPLGVLGIETVFRGEERKSKRTNAERRTATDSESRRWTTLASRVGEVLRGNASFVHVMDREADSYAILADIQARAEDFVIRLAHDRNLDGAPGPRGGKSSNGKLYGAMASSPQVVVREVKISRRVAGGRPEQSRRIHPPREGRPATLALKATTVRLARTDVAPKELPAYLTVNVVEVAELGTPDGQPPVLWRLVTSLPIDTPQAVERVVDIYRQRWRIEEFFKALKTGCAYEKRQLECREALRNALAIFSVVAWRLLLLRSLARAPDPFPAIEALTPTQLRVLRVAALRGGYMLPPQPTARDALLAVAAVGGHIKRNGEPGWFVLGRGLDAILLMELGWLAAVATRRSDES